MPYWYSWLPDLPAAYVKDSALHAALAALSLARVGQLACDNNLGRQSDAAYQNALIRVQREVNSRTCKSNEELIAAVLVLAMFEVCLYYSRQAPVQG